MKILAQDDGSALSALLTIDDTALPKDALASITKAWPHDVTALSGVTVGWLKTESGFTAPPVVPPTSAQLSSHAAAVLAAILAAGKTFDLGGGVHVLCDGTNDTRANLALFTLFGQANPTGTKSFVDNNGLTMLLTGTQLVTLATEVGTWIDAGYAALGGTLTAIRNGLTTTYAEAETALATYAANG